MGDPFRVHLCDPRRNSPEMLAACLQAPHLT